MKDTITIEDIEVQCHIGVPAEERAMPQRLLVTIEMEADTSTAGKSDDLEQTIDYHAVFLRACELSMERERKLIETLAEELAEMVLDEFAADAVQITIKKFILPQTRQVMLRIRRQRD